MSALHDVIALEKEARRFGFDWPNQTMAIEQAMDECREILEDVTQGALPEKIQEEIGDLLHAAISLCIFSGFDVEDTLTKIHAKFSSRMDAMKELTYESGLQNLQGQSMDFMLELWREAKIMSANKKASLQHISETNQESL